VNGAGTAASAQVDTLVLRDGPALLTAYASGAGSSRPKAAESLVVRVDNGHGDGHHVRVHQK